MKILSLRTNLGVHTDSPTKSHFQAVYPSQQPREIGKGAGGLWSVTRSSFMFDIVHKLFSLSPNLYVAAVGCLGWIGLSEAEVRPALLIIGRSKYSPTA